MDTTTTNGKQTRQLRFEREVHHVLAQFLTTGIERELPAYASLSAVECSTDLRHARVFFRLVGDDKAVTKTKEILDRERSAFQRRVAREIKAKFCPVLRFAYGIAPHHDEVDLLLENLHRPRHLTGE